MSAPDTKFLRSFQDHCLAKFLSEPMLKNVSCTSMRNQVLLAPEQIVMPWLATSPGNTTGSGLLIRFPLADPTDGDIPGAQMEVKLPIEITSADDIALESDIGSGMSAEQILVIVWLLLNQFLNQYLGSGNWYVSGFDPIQPAKGVYGYLLVLSVRFATEQPAKCAAPVAVVNAGTCTITCATAGAMIYYTLDGSFPGPWVAPVNGPANTSQVYNGSFAIASGNNTILLVASYIPNSETTIGSDVWETVIP